MRSQQPIQKCLFAFMAAALVAVAGCSGNGGSSTNASSGGGNGGNGGGAPGSNTVAITVNAGPTAAPPIDEVFVDGAFTSVTVCVPNSSNCQTIGGILVDTGSSGLRILSSAVSLPLPQQTGSGGAPVVECLPFLDAITWGPVVTADVTIGGEKAQSLPIQVIGTSQFPTIPKACTNFGPPQEDLPHLAANGLLGVGSFAQDCGGACTVSGGQNPGLYYACPAAGCAVTEESVAAQVANPVAFFATDNNGVMIQLPAVSSPEPSVSGSLTFGIGTQSNNALGSATVYTLDPNTGNITTTFKGVTYGQAFLDTGSNAIYFLDSSVTGIPTCADAPFWYCPSTTQSLSAVNRGTNGASTTVDFSVANADTLTANSNNAALPNLAGPQPSSFDFGLPFFFGRTVFISIEGKSAPGGTTPYAAY
jgi:Protein of unknown function (DUF3443)